MKIKINRSDKEKDSIGARQQRRTWWRRQRETRYERRQRQQTWCRRWRRGSSLMSTTYPLSLFGMRALFSLLLISRREDNPYLQRKLHCYVEGVGEDIEGGWREEWENWGEEWGREDRAFEVRRSKEDRE